MQEGLYGDRSGQYYVHTHNGSELDQKINQALRNFGQSKDSSVIVGGKKVEFRQVLTGNTEVLFEESAINYKGITVFD